MRSRISRRRLPRPRRLVWMVPPYKTDERDAVVVRFPGGYIAEIHSVTKK